jgi:hypothetical protein
MVAILSIKPLAEPTFWDKERLTNLATWRRPLSDAAFRLLRGATWPALTAMWLTRASSGKSPTLGPLRNAQPCECDVC